MKNQPRRKTIMLTVTHSCNLDCVYCYEPYKKNAVMTVETAKKAIMEEFENAEEHDEINVDFSGGEPFLNFSLIKEVCEWMWSRSWNKPFILSATTNGTMVHGRIKDWLKKNKQRFWACLSLDGTPAMHDMNRSNSWNLIDHRFFLESWPEQTVKMTVSKETLPYLSQGIIFLSELGFLVAANLAYGICWEDEKNLEIFNRELNCLMDYYLKNPATPVSSLLDHKIDTLAFEQKKHKPKYCGTGTDMVSIDVDGEKYPCHTFAPLALGANAQKMGKLDFSDEMLVDEECRDCPIFISCPACYGQNFAGTGDAGKRPKDLCRLHKVQLLGNMKFQALKLVGQKNTLVQENTQPIGEYLNIKAIQRVYNTIAESV